jgi:predicted RNase H-like HicB family nuclease
MRNSPRNIRFGEVNALLDTNDDSGPMITTHHEYRNYVFAIHYWPKEPVYAVDFADFPEIMTSGDTLAKAFANACEALDLHLESLQKLGRLPGSR